MAGFELFVCQKNILQNCSALCKFIDKSLWNCFCCRKSARTREGVCSASVYSRRADSLMHCRVWCSPTAAAVLSAALAMTASPSFWPFLLLLTSWDLTAVFRPLLALLVGMLAGGVIFGLWAFWEDCCSRMRFGVASGTIFGFLTTCDEAAKLICYSMKRSGQHWTKQEQWKEQCQDSKSIAIGIRRLYWGMTGNLYRLPKMELANLLHCMMMHNSYLAMLMTVWMAAFSFYFPKVQSMLCRNAL